MNDLEKRRYNEGWRDAIFCIVGHTILTALFAVFIWGMVMLFIDDGPDRTPYGYFVAEFDDPVHKDFGDGHPLVYMRGKLWIQDDFTRYYYFYPEGVTTKEEAVTRNLHREEVNKWLENTRCNKWEGARALTDLKSYYRLELGCDGSLSYNMKGIKA